MRGGSERPETAPQLGVAAGTYGVRVYYEGFRTISENGLEGDDAYHAVLWPAPPSEPRVLKRFDGPMPGG